ncbi:MULTISPECIES: hypothetical protein [Amycolatopsis]|uniref:Uncharacterized protein n=1 Tax=Amycolatopsis echigonensis TaxID=2576905 RepID=A0A2N3WLC3_9PSEU|nr:MULTISPECIES: hypothetical protein [Amycolatopsis]MBB2499899.1 hypothetical protein [Amycolatopsis echigonensis]MCG3751183.1 hypothetical protein [Amycolatopsis sp. Poz14]PKV94645.1 hypothetical protein ATK30_5525 [Amycolatopsis niigatensis]
MRCHSATKRRAGWRALAVFAVLFGFLVLHAQPCCETGHAGSAVVHAAAANDTAAVPSDPGCGSGHHGHDGSDTLCRFLRSANDFLWLAVLTTAAAACLVPGARPLSRPWAARPPPRGSPGSALLIELCVSRI